MREVDQFNALVAAYTSQQACNQNWMPLLHWHLDGSLANAFKLCELIGQARQEHQIFLKDVVVKLLEKGAESRRLQAPAPSISTQPKSLRGNHEWQDLRAIHECLMCCRGKKRGFGREISGNREAPPKIRGGCIVCKVYLCCKGDCVRQFHEEKGALQSIK